jgi:hypothetical protein
MTAEWGARRPGWARRTDGVWESDGFWIVATLSFSGDTITSWLLVLRDGTENGREMGSYRTVRAAQDAADVIGAALPADPFDGLA